jgi:hypothetical protein
MRGDGAVTIRSGARPRRCSVLRMGVLVGKGVEEWRGEGETGVLRGEQEGG